MESPTVPHDAKSQLSNYLSSNPDTENIQQQSITKNISANSNVRVDYLKLQNKNKEQVYENLIQKKQSQTQNISPMQERRQNDSQSSQNNLADFEGLKQPVIRTQQVSDRGQLNDIDQIFKTKIDQEQSKKLITSKSNEKSEAEAINKINLTSISQPQMHTITSKDSSKQDLQDGSYSFKTDLSKVSQVQNPLKDTFEIMNKDQDNVADIRKQALDDIFKEKRILNQIKKFSIQQDNQNDNNKQYQIQDNQLEKNVKIQNKNILNGNINGELMSFIEVKNENENKLDQQYTQDYNQLYQPEQYDFELQNYQNINFQEPSKLDSLNQTQILQKVDIDGTPYFLNQSINNFNENIKLYEVNQNICINCINQNNNELQFKQQKIMQEQIQLMKKNQIDLLEIQKMKKSIKVSSTHFSIFEKLISDKMKLQIQIEQLKNKQIMDVCTQTENRKSLSNIYNGSQITNNFKINLNIAGVPQKVENVDIDQNKNHSEENFEQQHIGWLNNKPQQSYFEHKHLRSFSQQNPIIFNRKEINNDLPYQNLHNAHQKAENEIFSPTQINNSQIDSLSWSSKDTENQIHNQQIYRIRPNSMLSVYQNKQKIKNSDTNKVSNSSSVMNNFRQKEKIQRNNQLKNRGPKSVLDLNIQNQINQHQTPLLQRNDNNLSIETSYILKILKEMQNSSQNQNIIEKNKLMQILRNQNKLEELKNQVGVEIVGQSKKYINSKEFSIPDANQISDQNRIQGQRAIIQQSKQLIQKKGKQLQNANTEQVMETMKTEDNNHQILKSQSTTKINNFKKSDTLSHYNMNDSERNKAIDQPGGDENTKLNSDFESQSPQKKQMRIRVRTAIIGKGQTPEHFESSQNQSSYAFNHKRQFSSNSQAKFQSNGDYDHQIFSKGNLHAQNIFQSKQKLNTQKNSLEKKIEKQRNVSLYKKSKFQGNFLKN